MQNKTEYDTQFEGFVNGIADATDQVRHGQAMQDYVKFAAKFYHYSPYNQSMIHFQNPEATLVKGYKAWGELGRKPYKGTGITIIKMSPKQVTDPKTNELKTVMIPLALTVFDIADTYGDPLPEAPNWRDADRLAEVQQRLMDFAGRQGIAVTERELKRAQGQASRSGIVLDPSSGTLTFVHELAHKLLGHVGAKLEHNQVEIEAELTAAIFGKALGLDTTTATNYLAFHGKGDEVKAALKRVQKVADQIITAAKGE